MVDDGVRYLHFAIKRNRPYSQDAWQLNKVAAVGLETTIRQQGGYRRNEST